MAVEYVRSINESPTPEYPQRNTDSIPMEGQRRQSLGPPPSRWSTGNPYHNFHLNCESFDQRIPESNDDTSRNSRRQSLQLGSGRRATLAAEADKRLRRSSLPNPTLKDIKPQRRVVGNGVYKLETLPWHESSLRQAVARRAHEKKEQLASPLPLINLRPEAETRLRDVLGEDGYADWRRKHRVSDLLNDG